jgi:hypothetical protein
MEARHPDELLKELSKELSLLESVERRKLLEEYLNHLLLNDFNSLINLLYRADVNEMQLKQLLSQNKDVDASVLIADLLIKRMEEKKESRNQSNTPQNIPEEDKW